MLTRRSFYDRVERLPSLLGSKDGMGLRPIRYPMVPSSLAAGRVDLKLYRGGHMFYTRFTSRQELTTDAEAFVSGQSGKIPGE